MLESWNYQCVVCAQSSATLSPSEVLQIYNLMVRYMTLKALLPFLVAYSSLMNTSNRFITTTTSKS